MSQLASDFFVDGFIAYAIGPKALRHYYPNLVLHNSPGPTAYNNMFLIRESQCRNPQGATRVILNGVAYIIVDYVLNSLSGPVIRQKVYSRGTTVPTAALHDGLQPPVFFARKDGGIGIYLVNAAAKDTSCLVNESAPIHMRGLTTTKFVLNWPFHAEFEKQEGLQDTKRQPITLGRLAMRIANFVDKFLLESTMYFPSSSSPEANAWRVWNAHRGHIVIIGLVHVSQGHWQPILQIDRHGLFPSL